MMTVRLATTVVLAMAAAGAFAACGGGDSGGSGGGGGVAALDGGAATGGGGTGGTGATGTGATGTGATGGSGGSTAECATSADCAPKLPATTPEGCAEAICDTVLGKCVFKAKDADGDGHAQVYCKPTGGGVIEEGDDCEDSNDQIFPGAQLMPCKAGIGECQTSGFTGCDGDQIICSAKPGTPSPDSPLCDGKDHDCDGKPNTGCGCNSGEKQTCYAGNADICNKVEIVCANGVMPACPTAEYKKEYCRDSDKDGYCDLNNQCGNFQCSAPDATWKEKGACKATTDCNDSNDKAYPTATELCDGVDNDCDGQKDEGYGVIPPTDCHVNNDTDGACFNGGTTKCNSVNTTQTICDPKNADYGKSIWHTSPAGNGSWDWNCNGKDQPSYTVVFAPMAAAACLTLSSSTCNTVRYDKYVNGGGCGKTVGTATCFWDSNQGMCFPLSSLADVVVSCM